MGRGRNRYEISISATGQPSIAEAFERAASNGERGLIVDVDKANISIVIAVAGELETDQVAVTRDGFNEHLTHVDHDLLSDDEILDVLGTNLQRPPEIGHAAEPHERFRWFGVHHGQHQRGPIYDLFYITDVVPDCETGVLCRTTFPRLPMCACDQQRLRHQRMRQLGRAALNRKDRGQHQLAGLRFLARPGVCQ